MNKIESFKKLPYRNNVGAMVFKGNKYLLIQYHGGIWKMPQGGVHDGETRKEALMRELKEELGTDKFKIIKRFLNKHQYDWDEEIVRQNGFKWRGQKQMFFLVEFFGKDGDIKLDTNELRDYCWATERELFKKIDRKSIFLKGYKKLVEKLLKSK